MNSYEEKQQRKLERFNKLKEKHERESNSRFESAKKIGDMIPMGQPILVGHHSEKGHRKDIARIDSNMRKGIEHSETADYYANKVKNIENPRGISSDDPEAIQKLEAKIIEQETLHAKLKTMKVNPNAHLMDRDSANMKSVYLTGYTSEIRRCKKRIEELKAKLSIPDVDEEKNGVRICTDKEDNRIRIHFPNIPSEEVRTNMKRQGWRWSPYNSAWQKQISGYGIDQAKKIMEEYK